MNRRQVSFLVTGGWCWGSCRVAAAARIIRIAFATSLRRRASGVAIAGAAAGPLPPRYVPSGGPIPAAPAPIGVGIPAPPAGAFPAPPVERPSADRGAGSDGSVYPAKRLQSAGNV